MSRSSVSTNYKQNIESVVYLPSAPNRPQHRILKTVFQPTVSTFTDHQIAQQLDEAIKAANQTVRKQKQKLRKNIIKKSQAKQLIGIDKAIQRKAKQINQVTQEIRLLKISQYSMDTSGTDNQFKLAQEISHMKEKLLSHIAFHDNQLEKYCLFKRTIRDAQKQYISIHPHRHFSYLQFKDNQQTNSIYQQKANKISQIHKKQSRQNDRSKSDNSKSRVQGNTTLRDLGMKKKKLRAALKNGAKKYRLDVIQLQQKLQFLRDQDKLVQQKLKQVVIQKEILQEKFKNRYGHRTKKVQKSAINSRPHYFQLV